MKRGIVFIVSLFLLATLFLLHPLQKTHAASVYFTKSDATSTPLTSASLPSGDSALELFLDTEGANVNGFDLTIKTTGNLQISTLQEAADAAKFSVKIFSEIPSGGKSLHYVKVSTDTSGNITGALHLATLKFTGTSDGDKGDIQFSSTTVTSISSDVGLEVTKKDVSYTVGAGGGGPPPPPPSDNNPPPPPSGGNPGGGTPQPLADTAQVKFNFTLTLPGIGSGGNANPVTLERQLTVEVFDKTNSKVLEQSGTVTFDTASGKYKGEVDMGTSLSSDVYTVKITTPGFLRKLVDGVIQDIKTGFSYPLPPTTLVPGDINGDNTLDIKDYNIYVSCFNKKPDTPECRNADINSDGRVDTPNDLSDYKLLFGSFNHVSGD